MPAVPRIASASPSPSPTAWPTQRSTHWPPSSCLSEQLNKDNGRIKQCIMYIFLSPPISQLNPLLLAIIVDLGQNFPPSQQLLDAHLEKMFAYQTTFLAIDCIPTLFLAARQRQPAFPQSCFRFSPPEATFIFALRSSNLLTF